MVNNKVKRNIWLALTVMSAIAAIDRAVRVAAGNLGWWNLISALIILAFCTRFYLCYRRQVNAGNLFGKVNPLKKRSEQ